MALPQSLGWLLIIWKRSLKIERLFVCFKNSLFFFCFQSFFDVKLGARKRCFLFLLFWAQFVVFLPQNGMIPTWQCSTLLNMFCRFFHAKHLFFCSQNCVAISTHEMSETQNCVEPFLWQLLLNVFCLHTKVKSYFFFFF